MKLFITVDKNKQYVTKQFRNFHVKMIVVSSFENRKNIKSKITIRNKIIKSKPTSTTSLRSSSLLTYHSYSIK